MAAEVAVVTPAGRLDGGSAPALEKTLTGRIAAGERRLLIDLAGLDYISSAGLRVLLVAAKRMKAAGGQLALCSLGKEVAEVFEISGFDALFEVHPSRASALARLSAA